MATFSRDLLQTVRRYYRNSFTDYEKQHSINVFLGIYIPSHDREDLWSLQTDYYLHNREDAPRPPLLFWFA